MILSSTVLITSLVVEYMHLENKKATSTSMRAIIQKVIGTVASNGYVVTKVSTGEGDMSGKSVTFSLSVWKEKILPIKKQVVQLSVVQLFEQGWRATTVSPITATENCRTEQQSNTQKRVV
jgi:hypothetical protein